MARLYYRSDVTAFSWDATEDFMTELGDGTLTKTVDTIANPALMDEFDHNKTTLKHYTFSGEIAGESGKTNWLLTVGNSGNLVFASAAGNIVSGEFLVTSASLKLGDALRWNVDMVNAGDVVES